LSLQKQMEHANQQTGFSDSSSLRPMHPQALHPAPGLLASPQLPVQMQPAGKVRMVIEFTCQNPYTRDPEKQD
ncbi:GPS2 isoform 16, partial [Pan troglodytes]